MSPKKHLEKSTTVIQSNLPLILKEILFKSENKYYGYKNIFQKFQWLTGPSEKENTKPVNQVMRIHPSDMLKKKFSESVRAVEAAGSGGALF